jgi:type I restriction enzyme S subunit
MLDKAKNRGVVRPYLRNANVRWGAFDLSDVLEMRVEDDELPEVTVAIGDLVICEGGEPGRCAVWARPEEMVVQKALHRARPLPGIDPFFFALHLRADCESKRIESFFTGATIKHLTGRVLEGHVVALPPLAEQRRIVARVDALMAICDRLEAHLRAAQQGQAAFAAAAVHHLDA